MSFLTRLWSSIRASQAPSQSYSFSPGFIRLPTALLEDLLGWLAVRDIHAARTVCRAWSTASARCPVLVLGLSGWSRTAVRSKSVRDLRVELTEKRHFVPKDLDVALVSLSNLERMSIVSSKQVLHIPPDSALARSLHTLDWVHYSAGGLTLMLSLPSLTRMVLRKCIGVQDTRADPACPLHELVLVDCFNMRLDFLDDLSRLNSLGFVQQEHWHGILPMHVPKRTRARIACLELRCNELVWHHGRISEVRLVSLAGYSRLLWLGISAQQPVLSSAAVVPFLQDIQDLTSLRTLKLDAQLPSFSLSCSRRLSSLTIACDLFPGIATASDLAGLRELCLLNCTCGSSLDLRGYALRKLRLERSRSTWKQTGVSFQVGLPKSLGVLELRGFRPWDTHVRTLYVDAQSFQLLDMDEQSRLKGEVVNLYVLSHLEPRSRYFASSFISDE